MNLLLLGTGNVFSSRLSPCFILDRLAVLELPNGAVKKMKAFHISPMRLRLCLFSHVHADHCFDFPFLLLEKLQYADSPLLIVGGPTGTANYLKSLCAIAYPTLNWTQIFTQTVSQFIEYPNSVYQYQLLHYSVTCHPVKHNDTPCSGFLISAPGSGTFAYTGDSSLCAGVNWLAERSDLCCADMNSINPSFGHMSLADMAALALQYPQKLYAVHTEDVPFLNTWHCGIFFPDDGTSLELIPDPQKSRDPLPSRTHE